MKDTAVLLDTSTLTVDTSKRGDLPHESILNITEDDESEDGENIAITSSFLLFDDGADDEKEPNILADEKEAAHSIKPATMPLTPQQQLQTPPRPCYVCVDEPLLLRTPTNTTETQLQQPSLLEGITERLVDGMCLSKNSPTTLKTNPVAAIQYDLWTLLGCMTPSKPHEMIHILGRLLGASSSSTTGTPPPRKRTVAQRQRRLRLLVQQHQTTPSSLQALPTLRTQSLATNHRWTSTEHVDDEGYDSDPQVTLPPPRRVTSASTNIHDAWQRHWHVLWYVSPGTQAVVCKLWLERGQFFNGKIVEPRLVLKPLESQNHNSVTISLLHVSRLFPHGPLGWTLRHEDESKNLECATPQEQQQLLTCLKHLVSRCLALVVVQDMRSWHEEFFVPEHASVL